MSSSFLLQIVDLKIICLFQYINQLYYQLHLYLKEGAENDGVSTVYCLSKPFQIWSFVIIVDIKNYITSRYLSKPFHIQSFVIIVNLKNCITFRSLSKPFHLSSFVIIIDLNSITYRAFLHVNSLSFSVSQFELQFYLLIPIECGVYSREGSNTACTVCVQPFSNLFICNNLQRRTL